MDLRRTIDDGPMSPFQIAAIAICLVVNMLDGFDVLAIAFTAPAIARDWSVPDDALGLLFSAGLAGMMAGSLFIAPFADRIGRRPVIVVCLVVLSAGMCASAAAADVRQLAAMRALTGLGIGGALASLNTIVAEYSPLRWRDFAVSLLQTGYPIGATIGGSIAVGLLASYGWRAVFVAGGLASTMLVPVVLWRLPESFDYLVTRRPDGALERTNALLARMGRPALDALPAADARTTPSLRAQVEELFSPEHRTTTILLWVAFFMVMASFYFALTWTPQILVASGLSVGRGVSGGVLMNVGGIVGAGLLGWASAQLGLRRLVSIYMAACTVAFVLFAALAGSLPARLAAAAMIGFFIFGSMVGLYAMAPRLYAPQVRTTAIGWAIGIGRGGAVLGPYVAGLLLASGWERSACYVLFAVPPLLSLAAVRSLPAWRT